MDRVVERLAAVVEEQAQRNPDHPWVESADGARTVDRAELAATARAWASAGVAGQRLGLCADDPVAFAVLFASLVAAGATVVPLDPRAPADSLRALLATARASAVVTPDATGPATDLGLPVVGADASTRRPPARSTEQQGAGQRGDAQRGVDGASLLFSSGSTGVRKAMRLPEAQLLHVARAVAAAHELSPADRGLNTLPLFHVNAEVVALLATLVSGGTVVLDARFHRTGFWDLARTARATWINAVPAIIAILAGAPEAAGVVTADDAARLRFVRSASAPLPVPVLERFERATGLRVIETYGMTEAASQITANPLDAPRAGSVGRPTGVELRVVAEPTDPADPGAHARPVAASPGEVGRVQLRGPGIITGYEGGVGADRFDADGWLDTGDLGSLDADGYLTLAGRSDDIINRGGEKIFPREVEEVLRAHPGVAEAVVVGRPHDVLGHVPVAYVIAGGPTAPDAGEAGQDDDALASDLVERCARALPRAHRPVELHVVPDLPLGPTGKLSRRLVAARFAPEQGGGQAAAQTAEPGAAPRA